MGSVERHLQNERPRGCPCVPQRPLWDGHEGGFGALIGKAMQETAGSAGLEGNIRQPMVGDKAFVHEVIHLFAFRLHDQYMLF